ncbi:MAG: hypothetical protein L6Q37_16235, partial [Bdellovibrionaceae bacterium]|nr:hypothetical protein [Pseudobdellovibrionaceae bacterium]
AFFHQAECKILSKENYYTKPKNVGLDWDSKYISVDSTRTNCTMVGGMSGGYVRNSLGQLIGVNSFIVDGFTYFSPILPLANCTDGSGKLIPECLKKLKDLILSWE